MRLTVRRRTLSGFNGFDPFDLPNSPVARECKPLSLAGGRATRSRYSLTTRLDRVAATVVADD